MQIENENTFREALKSGLNLFLGAGFSVLAQNADGKPLPLGSELAEEIKKRFNLPSDFSLTLSQLCTVVESTEKKALREFLEKRFRVATFDERYKNIDGLPFKTIYTTNIDDLLFKIYEHSREHYLNDIDSTGPEYRDRSAINLVYLHGCINNKDQALRFGTAELAAAFGADPDRWHFLTQGLQKSPTLFWGYSISDAGALQALSPETTSGRKLNDRWILLHPKYGDDANRKFFAALGFQIAVGSTEEMLGYLASFVIAPRSGKQPKRPTAKIFPNAIVPTIGSVPMRPIIDFFLGAAPEWSDIYSGILQQTSHYNRVLNIINARRNIIMLGAPACGKTTLLMQLAAHVAFDGHKVIFDSLTEERAQFIISRLEGERAILFLDNCCDSLEALLLLRKCPNIQLVLAERDYNFAFASHLMPSDKFEILDVTELSDQDIQSCLQSIPPGLVLRGHEMPERDSLAGLSLFEVIEANIARSTLSERFKGVLHQLRSVGEIQHDVLLMISYAHQCRVPVSFDMLYAYLRETTTSWEEVRKIKDDIGAMVSEYFGNLVANDQDYFVPRSALVSETIIEVADNPSLRRMLLRFHKEVSSYRICRYDVFRRHAYNADLFVRAFPDWKEGNHFYQELFIRDTSPFMLQQNALYLSRKKQHAEAFTMIERAIVQSAGRKLSIRNSHAIILFRANIEFASNETAQQSLRRSMETLTECYNWDKRKLFHAITFAGQALDYYKAVGGVETLGYLRTAKEWLEEQQKSTPWSRGVKRLLGEIRRIII